MKCEGNAAKRTNERMPESEITHDSEPEAGLMNKRSKTEAEVVTMELMIGFEKY